MVALPPSPNVGVRLYHLRRALCTPSRAPLFEQQTDKHGPGRGWRWKEDNVPENQEGGPGVEGRETEGGPALCLRRTTCDSGFNFTTSPSGDDLACLFCGARWQFLLLGKPYRKTPPVPRHTCTVLDGGRGHCRTAGMPFCCMHNRLLTYHPYLHYLLNLLHCLLSGVDLPTWVSCHTPFCTIRTAPARRYPLPAAPRTPRCLLPPPHLPPYHCRTACHYAFLLPCHTACHTYACRCLRATYPATHSGWDHFRALPLRLPRTAPAPRAAATCLPLRCALPRRAALPAACRTRAARHVSAGFAGGSRTFCTASSYAARGHPACRCGRCAAYARAACLRGATFALPTRARPRARCAARTRGTHARYHRTLRTLPRTHLGPTTAYLHAALPLHTCTHGCSYALPTPLPPYLPRATATTAAGNRRIYLLRRTLHCRRVSGRCYPHLPAITPHYRPYLFLFRLIYLPVTGVAHHLPFTC